MLRRGTSPPSPLWGEAAGGPGEVGGDEEKPLFGGLRPRGQHEEPADEVQWGTSVRKALLARLEESDADRAELEDTTVSYHTFLCHRIEQHQIFWPKLASLDMDQQLSRADSMAVFLFLDRRDRAARSAELAAEAEAEEERSLFVLVEEAEEGSDTD